MSDWWDQPGRCTLRASHRGAAAGRVIRTSLNAMPCIVWLILLVIIGDMRAMTPFRLSLYKWTRETQPKDNDYICITGLLAYYDFPLTQRVRCLENQKLWKMHHHTCTWRNPSVSVRCEFCFMHSHYSHRTSLNRYSMFLKWMCTFM